MTLLLYSCKLTFQNLADTVLQLQFGRHFPFDDFRDYLDGGYL